MKLSISSLMNGNREALVSQAAKEGLSLGVGALAPTLEGLISWALAPEETLRIHRDTSAFFQKLSPNLLLFTLLLAFAIPAFAQRSLESPLPPTGR